MCLIFLNIRSYFFSSLYYLIIYGGCIFSNHIIIDFIVVDDLLVMHNYCVIISECQKVTFLVDQQVFPLSFPSLLALVGVTIEKGLHWLPCH